MFSWAQCTEFATIIEKDYSLILYMYQHIKPTILIEIAKLASNRNKIARGAKEGRPAINSCVSRISTGELDDDYMAIGRRSHIR